MSRKYRGIKINNDGKYNVVLTNNAYSKLRHLCNSYHARSNLEFMFETMVNDVIGNSFFIDDFFVPPLSEASIGRCSTCDTEYSMFQLFEIPSELAEKGLPYVSGHWHHHFAAAPSSTDMIDSYSNYTNNICGDKYIELIYNKKECMFTNVMDKDGWNFNTPTYVIINDEVVKELNTKKCFKYAINETFELLEEVEFDCTDSFPIDEERMKDINSDFLSKMPRDEIYEDTQGE